MTRFITNDLIGSLKKIVDANTFHFKTDFDWDKKRIKTENNEEPNKTYAWITRECGTNLYSEADIFVEGSEARDAFLSWCQQESAKIYIVETDGKADAPLQGSIYRLDKDKYIKHVEDTSIPLDEFIEDESKLHGLLNAERRLRAKSKVLDFENHIESLNKQNRQKIEAAANC